LSRISDPTYLQTTQYKTSANLTARIELHRRFSTNPYGWHSWVFDQLNLQPRTRVLEVGGGPGTVWRENANRLPDNVSICLSDFSRGMVAEAKAGLRADARFTFVNADVQAIPFPTDTFDIVIANHMLYHVPNLALGIHELARVTRPGGRVYAATNGLNHMFELHELVAEFDPENASAMTSNLFARRFGLENAPEIMGRVLARVERRSYDDALWVTDPQALTDYVWSLSGSGRFGNLDHPRAEAFTAFVRAKIESAGGLHIRKEAGLAIGHKP
jgi:SAM-dependent methyltransferase